MHPARIGLRACAVLTILALCGAPASAQYHVESWTTDAGLPHNIVVDLLQARDGYIWLATFDGLVRFDGVRFTVFNRGNSPGLRNNRFTSLYEAADGAIWAGTAGSGVTRYARGVFTTFTTQDGLTNNLVVAVTGDAAGHLWVLSGPQIVEWDGARFQPAAVQGPSGPFYRSIWNKGVWWASERDRLHRFEAGQLSVRQLPPAVQGLSDMRVGEDGAGTLWMGTMDRRVARISGSAVRFVAISDLHAEAARLPSFYADRSGHQWPLMVNRSLVRFWSLPQARDTPVVVNATLEDREGNIWLAADGQGLWRIRQPRVTVYSQAQGLVARNVYPVLPDRSGGMWVGAWPTGVSHVTPDGVRNYTVADGLASGFVTSLAQDDQGRIWAASHNERDGGLRVLENGRFREFAPALVPPHTYIHAILHDRSGGLWLGTGAGLIRYADGVARIYTTRDGLAANDVQTIIEEPGGRIWVGTLGGITSWQDGVLRSWTERDGLPGGVVRSLYRDHDGVLWIGTYDGGLGRYKGGRFSRITTREGLYDNGVFQMLEDRHGYLWMCSNRGIHRVSKQALNAVADGTAERVTSLSLGRGDGLLNAECNGGTWPAGSIGPGGALWFPTQDGVAVVDPEKFTAPSRAVPAHIESVLIDRAPLAADAPVRITPGQQALEIHYTGLSLVNSERIRFRYRLTPLERDWVEVGTRRTAYYSHIPPGAYTFTVSAAGSDGAWANDVASVAVVVVPPFWQTWWFVAIVTLAIAGAAGLAHRRRVASIDAARAAQERFSHQLIDSQEQERRRIAAELHDSLGQHLIVIKNRAVLGTMTGDGAVKTQFDEISASASQSIEEVKQIAYNLRPYHLDRLGLATSIEAMAERLADSTNVEFTVRIPATLSLRRAVPKDQEINVFRIVQESLNNIVKHAEATHASIDIDERGSDLVLTIADNGRGFDTRATRDAAIGSGFGLAGVAERVSMLGGRHAVESTPGQGTTVTIAIPQRASGEPAE